MDDAQTPELLADAMLGKLARWLRVLGYDVLYSKDEDDAIAHAARSEGRLLLTRDQDLAQRRGLRTLLVQSDQLESQLVEVVSALGYPAAGLPQRCMGCNVRLEAISLEDARANVPAFVVENAEPGLVCSPFHRCPACERVFWRGTHWRAIEERLRKALAAARDVSGDEGLR